MHWIGVFKNLGMLAGMPIKGVKFSDFEFFSFGQDRRHIEPHFREKTKWLHLFVQKWEHRSSHYLPVFVRVSSSPCNKTTDFNNSSNAMALIVSYRFSSSLSPVPLDTPVSVAHWDVPGQMFPHWNCPDPGGGGQYQWYWPSTYFVYFPVFS